MAAELMSLRTMVEEYCDTCLKYNDLMLKYKAFKNVDTMSMHASIGCKSCDDTGCEYVANEMTFSIENIPTRCNNTRILCWTAPATSKNNIKEL